MPGCDRERRRGDGTKRLRQWSVATFPHAPAASSMRRSEREIRIDAFTARAGSEPDYTGCFRQWERDTLARRGSLESWSALATFGVDTLSGADSVTEVEVDRIRTPQGWLRSTAGIDPRPNQ